MHTTRLALVICAVALALSVASRAQADTLTLMWDPNPDSNVAGYIVYVGTQSGVYVQSHDVGNGNWFVLSAVPGQRYYFAVSSYAPGPIVGPRSAEVSGYANAPPTLADPGPQVSRVGEPASLQLSGSDPYGDPLTYAASGLPPGLSLTPGTGFIQGAGTLPGVYQVSATVSDGVLSATQVFTWTMEPPVEPEEPTAPAQSTEPEQPPADTDAPSVAITTPSSASSFMSTLPQVTLAGTATDNVGVTAVTWSSDRGGSGVATGTTDWVAAGIPLQAGVNVITVRARDAAGNEGVVVVSVTFVDADHEAPSLAVTSPTSASSYTTSAPNVTFAGTASDNVGVTEVTWLNSRGGHGVADGTEAWTAAAIPLAWGDNVITVTARDAAGHSASRLLTVTRVDDQPPSIVLLSPAALGGAFTTTDASLGLAGTAADNVDVTSVTWTSDDGRSGVADGTVSWSIAPIALEPGETQFVVTAQDAAGHQASVTLLVTMTPPVPLTVAITSPVADGYTTAAGIVELAGVAGGHEIAEVAWSNNRGGSGGAVGLHDWSVPAVALQPGTNVIRVTARCSHGETAAAEITVVYESNADVVAPFVSIVVPTSAPQFNTSAGSLMLAGIAVDNVAVTEVRWQSSRGARGVAQLGAGVWSAEVPIQNGNNVITVTARDAAGNTAEARLSVHRSPNAR